MRVVGVRFKKAGKIHYFTTNLTLERGEIVIAQTEKGAEYGRVEIIDGLPEVAGENQIIRAATEADHQQHSVNKTKETDAFGICVRKIREHGLPMKLIDVDLTLDRSKITFYFSSEQRVDFRELVKELATIFRTRIELRQIGARDEAKAINAVGPCGRILCCSTFLKDFQPVSIKMAKDQGLSLNPSKISGVCGRLMCCLKYEEDTYDELNAILPKEGDIIITPEGRGKVMGVNVLRQIIKASVITDDGEINLAYFDATEIEIVKREESKKIEEKIANKCHFSMRLTGDSVMFMFK